MEGINIGTSNLYISLIRKVHKVMQEGHKSVLYTMTVKYD